jgi:hypothetical protein
MKPRLGPSEHRHESALLDFRATPKNQVIPDLSGSGTTITRSGISSRSPERNGHNESESKCLRQRILQSFADMNTSSTCC